MGRLGDGVLAARCRALADSLSQAINAHLWNAERSAYTDCLRDGTATINGRVVKQ